MRGSGGHPSPIVRRGDGRLEVVGLGGTLLGVFDEVGVGTATVRLEAGDTLLLVTDGLFEARADGAPFDEAGVERVMASGAGSAAALAAALEDAVLRHTGGSLTDDMAAVVLRAPSA